MAYLMKADHKLDLPRRLQMEFSRVVQRHADTEGGEVTSDQLWQIFSGEYLTGEGPLDLVSCTSVSNGNGYRITATVRHNGVERQVEGEGNGPLSAFVDGLALLGYDVRVLDYTEHALSSGGDAQAVAYVETEIADADDSDHPVLWGVGVDSSIVTASLRAVCSAVNRAFRGREHDAGERP